MADKQRADKAGVAGLGRADKQLRVVADNTLITLSPRLKQKNTATTRQTTFMLIPS